MTRAWVRVASAVLSAASLMCWAVMFLSGHDVWNDLGRPDLWNLEGVPYNDLRAFLVAFYALAAALAAHAVIAGISLISRPRQGA